MEHLLLTISQMGFSFFRTLNVRYTSNNMVFGTVWTGFMIKLFWLYSSYVGISAMINKDFIMILLYIVTGIVGDWLSFKIKIDGR